MHELLLEIIPRNFVEIETLQLDKEPVLKLSTTSKTVYITCNQVFFSNRHPHVNPGYFAPKKQYELYLVNLLNLQNKLLAEKAEIKKWFATLYVKLGKLECKSFHISHQQLLPEEIRCALERKRLTANTVKDIQELDGIRKKLLTLISLKADTETMAESLYPQLIGEPLLSSLELHCLGQKIEELQQNKTTNCLSFWNRDKNDLQIKILERLIENVKYPMVGKSLSYYIGLAQAELNLIGCSFSETEAYLKEFNRNILKEKNNSLSLYLNA